MWFDAQERAIVLDEPMRDPRHWFVAKLRPGGFARARQNLGRQGFETFMAMRLSSSRKRGRLALADKPVFPGYLFVQVPPDRLDWRCINATYGVASLVALVERAPTGVPVSLMSGLFACCEGEVWQPRLVGITPGTTLRVIAGPFAEAIVTVEALPDGERILVLLDLLGRSVRVGVDARDVERV